MFLKNKNIIFNIRRSKVTDYAALKKYVLQKIKNTVSVSFETDQAKQSESILFAKIISRRQKIHH